MLTSYSYEGAPFPDAEPYAFVRAPEATTGPVGAPVGEPPGGSTETAIVAPC